MTALSWIVTFFYLCFLNCFFKQQYNNNDNNNIITITINNIITELGFLASVSLYGARKSICPVQRRKKESQQHIFDKKPHERNLKKGDDAFNPLCPLCT
jgi:hypothetical protein